MIHFGVLFVRIRAQRFRENDRYDSVSSNPCGTSNAAWPSFVAADFQGCQCGPLARRWAVLVRADHLLYAESHAEVRGRSLYVRMAFGHRLAG